ncbi:MAG: hypothetical protein ACTSU9_17570, partial [Promethearchaeota archaeon]
MEAVHFHGTTFIPRDTPRPGTFKTLQDINGLLTMSTRRNARVEHEPGTMEKAILMLITSIMAGCGLDDAAELIKSTQSLLYSILDFISESGDVAGTVEQLKSIFNPERGHSPLIVNRTTVSNMIPDPDRTQLDEALEEQAARCLDDLDAAGLKHKHTIHAADGTGFPSKTRNRNGDMQYIHVGQKNTFKQGFYFEAQHNVSDKLFVGLKHHDNWHRGLGKGMFEPWLQAIVDKCANPKRPGSTPTIVEGDRFYFKVGLFAAATLGFLDPGGMPGQGPRVVTPVKFTGEKNTFKWNYLRENKHDRVFTRYFKLKTKDHPLLAAAWAMAHDFNDKKGYRVPYACVALVDEYGKSDKRTLDQVRAEATIIHQSLKDVESTLETTVQEYIDYTGIVHAEKKKSPVGNRGRNRKKFVNKKEADLYRACFILADRKAFLQDKKQALMKSVTFFGISLYPGENPASSPATFLELAHEYHERWGVENGLKDVKWRFLYQNRARGPVRRTFFMVLAMMLYNRWQVQRALERHRSSISPTG